ncbi:putative glycosyl hydrolase [Paraburkholderia sp. RAU2J]|uniref:glycosyl hydrolase n=1 Tax=Paraburkholderia sp. RAU2J TaxID=1938810 RepID=UPI000F223568|nr:glycosyl hydrolase [Paraburkholderia sp. RAU2J]RKT22096.1 putative glycosyl hydrolase [Paraburkholderia sp. RAU2J]
MKLQILRNHSTYLVLPIFAACGGGSDAASVANAASDPVAVVNVAMNPASVSGAAIPPSASLNDSSGAVWSVKKGVVYRAGQTVGSTANVKLLLWYAGKMYAQNTGNNWWVWQNNNWVQSADPRPAASTAAIPFFGINEHYNYGGIYTSIPLATQAATLSDLGLTANRQDIHSYDQIDAVANTVIPGMGSKITIMPMIDAYPWDDPSLNGKTPTEASAYAYAYSMAAYAATKLKGVPVVEFGNEYDNDGDTPVANDGANVSDYDNNTWPIWRGALRGSYDGWRSVDTAGSTKIIATASVGFLHLGWYKGMLTGVQPDGTTGHPVVKTDIIQLHWYSDGGDPENTWGVTGTNYNVLKSLHDAYNLPIMFTEIGVNTDFTTAQAQTYINKTIPELVAAKATYNVIGFNWYELYDDPTGDYGILTSNASQKPIYATIKQAVAASQ